MMEIKKVDISTTTFLKVIIIFAILGFLFLVKEILALIFLALIFSSSIDPWISWLRQRKIPKALSILIIYAVFVGIFLTIIILIIPPVARETAQLARLFPDYYTKLNDFFGKFQIVDNTNAVKNLQLDLNSVSNNLTQALGSLFTTTIQVFGGIFSFITILIMAFYFAMEDNAIKKFSESIIPKKYQTYVVDIFSRVQIKLGQWFRGQLILSLIIFSITFLLLIIFGIRYAIILALLAGAFEIIPYFGPWASGLVAVLLTFTQSPGKALIVVFIYLGVQQLENSIIVPKVIGKSVGLNPLIVVIAILVGFKLGGILGALVSVPIAAALSVFVVDFLNKKKI